LGLLQSHIEEKANGIRESGSYETANNASDRNKNKEGKGKGGKLAGSAGGGNFITPAAEERQGDHWTIPGCAQRKSRGGKLQGWSIVQLLRNAWRRC